MEANVKSQPRVVRRCYQCCRHQEQIWVLAYEQVYPQARRVLPIAGTNLKSTNAAHPSPARRA